MATKTLKTRIQHTHDTEAKWKAKTSFVPKAGEVIVYDPDSTNKDARFKIGDGSTKLSALPFFASGSNNPSKSMLDKASPNLLNIQYSTKPNGWRLHASQSGTANSGTIYMNDSAINKQVEYSQLVTLDPAKATTVNIQRINDGSLPGDFSFANAKLKPVLNQNPDLASTTGWTLTNGSARESVTINGETKYAIKTNCATSNKSVLKTSTISWTPNTTYELSLKMANYSQSNYAYIRIKLAYYNGVSTSLSVSADDSTNVTGTTESSGHYVRVKVNSKSKWHTVTIKFTTKETLSSSYTANPIEFLTYEADAGQMYLADIVLKQDINLLPAAWSNWVRESWYYPVSKYAPLTTDTSALTASSNPTTLAKYTISSLTSGVTLYELSSTATRLSSSYQWQDYITITDAEKYQLMNLDAVDIVTNGASAEFPKMGGPWATVIEPEYNVKAVVDCTSIKASLVVIGAVLPNAKKATISLNTVTGTNFITGTTSQIIEGVDDYYYTIMPVPQNIDYDKLEVIVDFSELKSTSTSLGNNYLQLVQVYGAPCGHINMNTNFGHDVHGNVQCTGIYANSYHGTIDDGRMFK